MKYESLFYSIVTFTIVGISCVYAGDANVSSSTRSKDRCLQRLPKEFTDIESISRAPKEYYNFKYGVLRKEPSKDKKPKDTNYSAAAEAAALLTPADGHNIISVNNKPQTPHVFYASTNGKVFSAGGRASMTLNVFDGVLRQQLWYFANPYPSKWYAEHKKALVLPSPRSKFISRGILEAQQGIVNPSEPRYIQERNDFMRKEFKIDKPTVSQQNGCNIS